MRYKELISNARHGYKNHRLKRKEGILNLLVWSHKKSTKIIKRKKNKTVLNFSSDDTDCESEMHLESEEDTRTDCEGKKDTDSCADEDDEKELDCKAINVGDYVLANVSSVNSKRSLLFVGKVVEKDSYGLIVTFLKRKGSLYKFFFPEKEDKCYVSFSEVLRRLPAPILAADTSRRYCVHVFFQI